MPEKPKIYTFPQDRIVRTPKQIDEENGIFSDDERATLMATAIKQIIGRDMNPLPAELEASLVEPRTRVQTIPAERLTAVLASLSKEYDTLQNQETFWDEDSVFKYALAERFLELKKEESTKE